MLVYRPLILLEFSVREPTRKPTKLLQDVRHLYRRFPGEFEIMAVNICSTYMLQMLHIKNSELSISHTNSFGAFKVSYGCKIDVIVDELRSMINCLYGYARKQVLDIGNNIML